MNYNRTELLARYPYWFSFHNGTVYGFGHNTEHALKSALDNKHEHIQKCDNSQQRIAKVELAYSYMHAFPATAQAFSKHITNQPAKFNMVFRGAKQPQLRVIRSDYERVTERWLEDYHAQHTAEALFIDVRNRLGHRAFSGPNYQLFDNYSKRDTLYLLQKYITQYLNEVWTDIT